jgi:hypothetical protein
MRRRARASVQVLAKRHRQKRIQRDAQALGVPFRLSLQAVGNSRSGRHHLQSAIMTTPLWHQMKERLQVACYLLELRQALQPGGCRPERYALPERTPTGCTWVRPEPARRKPQTAFMARSRQRQVDRPQRPRRTWCTGWGFAPLVSGPTPGRVPRPLHRRLRRAYMGLPPHTPPGGNLERRRVLVCSQPS